MIQMEHLTKSYGRARGVTDLSLHVPEGSCFGFIGPNGAGKSTTIRTLLGLLSPTGGSAKIMGLDCVKNRTAILSQVGYMPSEAMFYPNLRGPGAGRKKADSGAEPGQPEEGLHRLRHAAPAPAVCTGRAHQRPGPPGPAGFLEPAGGAAA